MTNKKWSALWELVEKGELQAIDYYFAEQFLPMASEEQASFLAALMCVSRQGHICVSLDEVPLFFENEAFVRKVQKGVEGLPQTLPFRRVDSAFYLERNWFFETKCIENIERLCSLTVSSCPVFLEETLTEEQKAAVSLAWKSPISLIVGGPGTGKTYTAQSIAKSSHKQSVLAAPTGKAAARLGGKTIHSLLGIKSFADIAKKEPFLSSDLLLVDECSMIDAPLFSCLLAAVREGVRLVLMGDPFQLPAVESGSLFADLVQLAEEGYPIPCTRLTKRLRTDRQEILRLSKAIEEGKIEEVVDSIRPVDLWDLAKTYFSLPAKELPPLDELYRQMERFRILSCVRKGPLGVDTINALLAERFGKRAAPIILTQSAPRLDLSNGETGILLNDEKKKVYFPEKGVIPFAMLPPFEYAYALSIARRHSPSLPRKNTGKSKA